MKIINELIKELVYIHIIVDSLLQIESCSQYKAIQVRFNLKCKTTKWNRLPLGNWMQRQIILSGWMCNEEDVVVYVDVERGCDNLEKDDAYNIGIIQR